MSTMQRFAIISLLILWTAPAGAGGTTEEGARIAAEVCSECHVTGLTHTGTDIAEPFRSIVSRRSDDYLRGFLANPHARNLMPPFLLSEQEQEDIVAYMRTLRTD